MSLKIGILGCRGIPNAYGGFEQFAEKLSAGLVLKGHEVFVYNSSLHYYKKKQWQGVNIIHCTDLEDRLGAAGQFIYDWNCINDSRKRNFDILLQLGYTSNSIWYWRWPKNSIHVVNMDGLEWKRTQYSKPVRKFIKKAEALAVKNADHMVADSPGIQQHILDTYGKAATYIPYAADVFDEPDASLLNHFCLCPHQYYLVVSRLEPENNVEMIVEGYMSSKNDCGLVIVGGINQYGKHLKEKYACDKIKFVGSIYDKKILNNLRYFSKLHFHGHSVGGTNPSLLEAMACRCTIVAHDNIFNKAVLGSEAEYFSDSTEVSAIIDSEYNASRSKAIQEKNLNKIRDIFNWEKVVAGYENLMIKAVQQRANSTDLKVNEINSFLHPLHELNLTEATSVKQPN